MKTFNSSSYNNDVKIPSSKSYLQRAIAIASLIDDTTIINGYYPSSDALAALEISKEMGASIIVDGELLSITGAVTFEGEIDISAGESGLSTRMFAPIIASKYTKVIVRGEGSVLNRSQEMVIDGLTKTGLNVQSNKGFLPLEIEGEMNASSLSIDGTISSQFLTGLLIAFSSTGNYHEILVENLASRPYVDMTIAILGSFGVEVMNHNYEKFTIAANQKLKARKYKIEGDWSAASFHAVAGAIGGKVEIRNLNTISLQSDIAILKVLELCGAEIVVNDEAITINKKNLNAFEFDATQCPDLFPPLLVLAIACEGISKISGVHRLIHKESNRAEVLQSEFSKLGAQIEIIDDTMLIKGGRLASGVIDSNNDHRIAMAAAISSLICDGKVEVENPNVINKSYPTFYIDFEKGVVH